MPDDRLRKVERQFQATGSREHEEALLHERLRSGDLRQDQVLLAAYLGKTEARSVLSAQGLVGVLVPTFRQFLNGELLPIDLEADLGGWLLYLDAFEPEVAVRAAMAVGNWAADESAARQPDRPSALEVAAVSAAEEFLRCPCDSHARACGLAWQNAESGADRVGYVPASIWPLKAASRVARTAAASWQFRDSTAKGRVAWCASTAAGWATENLGSKAETERAQAEVRARVQAELVPWVLDGRDPFADRVGPATELDPQTDSALEELLGKLAQIVSLGPVLLAEEGDLPAAAVRLW